MNDYARMIQNAIDAADAAIVFPSPETRTHFRACMVDTIETCLPDNPNVHAARPRVSFASLALGFLAGAVAGKALLS